MLLIVLSICLCVAATAILVTTTVRAPASERVRSRLAALHKESAEPISDDGKIADIRKSPDRSIAIPWLGEWLTKMNLAGAASMFLYQSGISISLAGLLLRALAGFAALASILYLRLGDLFPAVILASGALPLPFLYVQRRRLKRLSMVEQQLPDALGMMVSALRVGHSLVASLGAVAQESPEPIGKELRKCFDEQNFGLELRVAFKNLTDRAPVQDIRIFVAAVLIQKESGGNLAEVLEKLAQTTRERFRLRKQVSVHTAQGRMTGWVLSLLPMVLGLGMYLVNPDGMSVLWTRPIGLKLLCAAAVMDIIGALIIRKIVRIRV